MDQQGSRASGFERPPTVRLTRVLVYLNALAWFLFGLIVALGIHPAMPSDPVARWGVAILAFGCAVCLVGLGWLLSRRSKAVFWSTVAILVVLSLATSLDEVGLADLLALAIIMSPLILLIKDRNWYLSG